MELNRPAAATGNSSSLYVEPASAEDPIEWPALELKDVFKIYREGGVESVALRGLDLTVDAGEMVAVMGPSGSGKSTLLTLAAALDVPSAGEVRAFGQSLARLGETELAEYRAQQVAIVFQADNLWPGLSVQENVVTALRLAQIEQPAKRARDSLTSLGLGSRLNQLPSQLSGGEQQRVAIAAAAARRAPLILADEPTGELDRHNEQTVLEDLRELCSSLNSAIVVVTHSSRVAESCDRVVRVRDGVVES